MKYACLVLGFSVFAASACSSSSTNNPDASGSAGTTGAAGTGEAGTTGSAGTTGAAGTNACTSIGHTGAGAPEVAGQGTFPTPAGGAVADGTYDLKEFRIYPPGSVDAYIRHESIKLAGNKTEQAGVSSADNVEKFGSGTFATSGAMVMFTIACPGPGTASLPYTATAGELWLFDTSPGNMEVHVYTKRP